MSPGQARLIGHLVLIAPPQNPGGVPKTETGLHKSGTGTPSNRQQVVSCLTSPILELINEWTCLHNVFLFRCNPWKVSGEQCRRGARGVSFETMIMMHVCLCPDRDRWSGSHQIYQRMQFIEYCQGRVSSFWNTAFKSEQSISPLPVYIKQARELVCSCTQRGVICRVTWWASETEQPTVAAAIYLVKGESFGH